MCKGKHSYKLLRSPVFFSEKDLFVTNVSIKAFIYVTENYCNALEKSFSMIESCKSFSALNDKKNILPKCIFGMYIKCVLIYLGIYFHFDDLVLLSIR